MRTRWMALCRRIGARPGRIFEQLKAAYSQPHRAYHTLAHIQHCLQEFEPARSLAEHPDEVEMALWFHDAVYDTHAQDNEEKSAAWAQKAARAMGLSAAFGRRVRNLILATRHDRPPRGIDAMLVVDCDLSSLGLPPDQFRRNDRSIRREYAWVPDEIFASRRAGILGRFLARPSIYSTPFFRRKYEARARGNLKR